MSLRFYYVILANLFRAPLLPYMSYMGAHPEKYSEERRYHMVQHIIKLMKNAGNIHTKAYGVENLPKTGGYIMFPNHQGKYDALGIIHTHEKPCAFVMDEKRSHMPVVRQVVSLLQSKRMVLDDVRQSMQIINEMAKEVREGKKYIIFPEGGYDDKADNHMETFKAGTFKSAVKAKCPIVPVALVDSYKVFMGWSLKRIETQVHYLKPIPYEEYKGMKTVEIAALVQERIEQVLTGVPEEEAESEWDKVRV